MAIILLVSCGQKKGNENKKVFSYNESSGITSLDPAFTRNLENMWAVNQLFDGLVELDSNMNVQPLIAKSWDISEDGLTYTFHLRDEVYFHPHELFTDSSARQVVASDFIYSFNRIVDSKIASPGSWVFKNVNFNDKGGFAAIDDKTLQITLIEPFPPFLGMLAMQYCNVVPREIVDHYGQDFRNHPIGTGPFKFAFWIENVALVYHKHDSFWQKDEKGANLPYLDAVKIDFVKDMSSEYLGLLKGEYDFMSGIHPAYKDELLDPYGSLNQVFDDKIYFQKTPFIKTDYLGILVDDSLELSSASHLKQKKVRQAINYGINREEMVRFLRNNSVYPAGHGFIPRGLPSFDENASYGFDYDIEKAKQLLIEAGFPNGEGLEEINISTTSDYVDLCEYIQHQLGQIGIRIKVDILPGSTHREYVSKSKVLMFRKSWLADYADAENFLGLFYSENFCPQGPNYTHYYNPSVDSLFVLARAETNDSTRYSLYQQMDSLVMDDSPVIPLFYDQVSHFLRKGISGFETNPINMLELKRVVKE